MRYLASLAFVAGALLAVPALAQFQPVILMCGDPPAPCSATNPIPTTPGTSTTQDVNLTKVGGAAVATGHGTAAGALRVELPTDGTGVVGLAAGSAVIGHVINDAGAAIIGKVGIDQTTPGTTNGVAIAPTNGSAAGLAATVSSAAESSHVMCSAACNAYDFFVTTGAAAGFLLWFDATSAPVDGAVTPNGCISIAATSSGGPPPSTIPRRFSTGLTLVYSTTGCFNQTKSATAFFNARVSQ